MKQVNLNKALAALDDRMGDFSRVWVHDRTPSAPVVAAVSLAVLREGMVVGIWTPGIANWLRYGLVSNGDLATYRIGQPLDLVDGGVAPAPLDVNRVRAARAVLSAATEAVDPDRDPEEYVDTLID